MGRTPHDDFVAVWRAMHDFLTKEPYHLSNLIWVYESHTPAHQGIPVDYYYPGDDYVDVYGNNFYDDDWDNLYTSNAFSIDAERISRYYPKVFAFPQAGPGVGRDGDLDANV